MEMEINKNYTKHYLDRTHKYVYPTEFVVRTFLANYPNLSMKKPEHGDKVLDIAFGDGRNTIMLLQQGYDVSGIEVTEEIVEQTRIRLKTLKSAEGGNPPILKVGRNSRIPFDDDSFDYILACNCCYYCDEGESMRDNLREYSRVLKPGGFLVASAIHAECFIFDGAEKLPDGTMRIAKDPYNNRVGYRLHGFSSTNEVEDAFSSYFHDFSFAEENNDYYGIAVRAFWVVCRNKD